MMTKPQTKQITINGHGPYDVCSMCELTPAFCACKNTYVKIETSRGAFAICSLCFHSFDFCECPEPNVVKLPVESASDYTDENVQLRQRVKDLEWENRVLRKRQENAS